MGRRPSAAGALTLVLLSCSPAEDAAPRIAVANGWARESAPGQSSAAVYLTVINTGDGEDRLADVAAAPPARAKLHSTAEERGVVRMRPLTNGLRIAPRSTRALRPGGTHVMLTGLNRRLSPGQTIGLTLDFARSGKRRVAIRVVPAGTEAYATHGMNK
ncbi:MAG: copper chaperone PCu(A)C [Sphingomonas sp.]|nr:copper chaperone PCu(A)C [Sphingomonas sp.]